MYRSLLVPLDGSSFSEQALPVAGALALQNEATVHVVHVHTAGEPIYVEGLPVIDDHFRSLAKQHEQAYLENAARRIAPDGKPATVVAVLDGSVAPTLTVYSVAHSIDLVILSSHGYSGFERAWLGSVTDALVRQSPIPLLVLRPASDDISREQPGTFRRITIPLDGSTLAERVMPFAQSLATPSRTTYTLLHVVHPSPRVSSSFSIDALDDEGETVVQRVRAAEKYLHQIAERWWADGYATHVRVLIHPQPAVAILEDARQHDSDLIAISTHGRSGFSRLLLGSVADKIVRGASVPVLLYRPVEQSKDGFTSTTAAGSQVYGRLDAIMIS